MGNTRTFEIPWVEAWVFKEFSGWVLGGCCAGAAWVFSGCTAIQQKDSILDHIQIHWAHTEISHGCNVGATWVYCGCSDGYYVFG